MLIGQGVPHKAGDSCVVGSSRFYFLPFLAQEIRKSCKTFNLPKLGVRGDEACVSEMEVLTDIYARSPDIVPVPADILRLTSEYIGNERSEKH